MSSQNKSGRLFRNPWVEALTKTHIAVPLSLFYATSSLAVWYSIVHLGIGVRSVAPLFLTGLVFFTLIEYLVHRHVYHMPASSPRRARIQYVFHGVHHEHPRDKSRLALPPVLSVVVSALFIGLFRLSMGASGFAFGGGFLTGYATYLLVHYSIHAYRPPKNFLRALWKHHNLHHFAGDTSAFGVSSPLWDHVFGTMPDDQRAKADQPFAAASGADHS
ncbi:MAG: sterol desaturase family protein [Flavobacteriales bacterium]|nr:sterol desaturase family protein [Flavobacteriales bacterium]